MPISRKSKTQPTLDLTQVLEALADPTRRQILLQLSQKDLCCGTFDPLGPKTRLTYHFNRLREAGLVTSTRDGRYRILSLRRQAIEQAFPRLLESVLEATRQYPGL